MPKKAEAADPCQLLADWKAVDPADRTWEVGHHGYDRVRCELSAPGLGVTGYGDDAAEAVSIALRHFDAILKGVGRKK